MDKGFNILHKIIQAAGIRQKVIASNLANVDTPGYKAKDVKFDSLLNEKISMIKTNRRHMIGQENNKIDSKIFEERGLTWSDQNNVELNKEVAKMNENALLHNSALKILGTKIKMYKNAINTRR